VFAALSTDGLLRPSRADSEGPSVDATGDEVGAHRLGPRAGELAGTALAFGGISLNLQRRRVRLEEAGDEIQRGQRRGRENRAAARERHLLEELGPLRA